MKRNYTGKGRNSAAAKLKIHFVKDGKNVCNVFQYVPTGTEDKNKINCVNCANWLKANKA